MEQLLAMDFPDPSARAAPYNTGRNWFTKSRKKKREAWFLSSAVCFFLDVVGGSFQSIYTATDKHLFLAKKKKKRENILWVFARLIVFFCPSIRGRVPLVFTCVRPRQSPNFSFAGDTRLPNYR